MKCFSVVLVLLGVVAGGLSARGSGEGDQVVVVYNTRMAESKGVAEHYAEARHVPKSQIIGFDLPTSEEINRTEFREQLEKPLLKALESKGLFHFESKTIPATGDEPARTGRKLTRAKIRYLLLCYGVPVKISEDSNLREPGAEKIRVEFRRNEAAVDDELACLPIAAGMLLAGPHVNPWFGTTNALQLDPANGILLVTRLDGPTAVIARGLVDKAIQAESDGLWGRAYFDSRGLDVTNAYHLGDEWIHAASEACRRAGFETVVDSNGGTFPVSFPLSQVAFYAGWYDENVSGPFTRPTVEFMPGAFAYHLHSFSAGVVRTARRQWVGPLLDKGATATMGCVAEPYLAATPNIGVFFERFVGSGFTFGEAAYAGHQWVSWQTTVIGDPLYRPFGHSLAAQRGDLTRRHSKLLEWAYERMINISLINGERLIPAVDILEAVPESAGSAVLQEKLADLYHREGKPSSAVSALEKALKLDPSPQQRIRITFTLADDLVSLQRDGEAYELVQEFIKDSPDYPDAVGVYHRLLALAEKLGRTADAEKYRREISQLNSPNGQTPTKRES